MTTMYATDLKKTRMARLKLAAMIVVSCLSLCAGNADAATVTSSDLSTASCNPTYYESLKSRAWLEAQRRTRQAQNYIRKPDSVLDYSCFPILNNIAALETEQIFSEYHAGHCFPDSLDCSLDRLVIDALEPYLQSNFNHTFIGGRTNVDRDTYDADNVTMCTVMKDVWQLAKCQNFMPKADEDGFLTFEEYVSTDPRQLPEPCANPYPKNNDTPWNDKIEDAFEPSDASSWYKELTTTTATANNNFRQWLDTGNAGLGCGTYIATGIWTYSMTSTFYRTAKRDGVCTNPACSPNSTFQCVVMTY